MRVLIIILVISFAGILVIGGLGYWAWVKYGDEYMSVVKSGYQEGVEVAQNGTDRICYEASLKKIEGCTQMRCAVEVKVFALACFEKVAVVTDLCASVPKIVDIFKYSDWVKASCETLSTESPYCDKVMEETAKYCMKRS